ncbi:MAG: FtsX-like permease family protein [Candidatus Melainabacteria bacterium]|nr:MAG: FtsX-like permease family protein [Candidatus Melainabacteria bacterium]
MNFASLFYQFIIRDFSANKARTILTVLGIALGVGVMLSISLANQTALKRFEDNLQLVTGKADLVIAPTTQDSLNENLLRDLTFLWDQNISFTPIVEQLTAVPGDKPDIVLALGVDVFADQSFRSINLDQKKNTPLEILNDNAVLVGERFAERHHLKDGSPFKILANDKEVELKTAGILKFSQTGMAFGGNVLVMDIGTAQKMFSMQGRVSRIDLMSDQKIDPETIIAIQKILPINASIESPSNRNAQVQKMLQAFQNNLMALSLVSMLVGAFVIYNTMSIIIIRKRAEIGILRTLGLTRSALFGLFLGQTLLFGLFGSALGLFFGTILANGTVKAVQKTVVALYTQQPAAQVALDPTMLVGAFVIGIIFTIAASLVPILEATQVQPSESMRRGSFEAKVDRSSMKLTMAGLILLAGAAVTCTLPAINNFPVMGYLSAILTVFGVSFCLPKVLQIALEHIKGWLKHTKRAEPVLASANLRGSLGRTSVAIASLMLGIAMMVSLNIMIASFRETVIMWVNQTLQADLYIESTSRSEASKGAKLSQARVDALKNVEGVEDIDSFVQQPFVYKGRLTNLGSGKLDVLEKHTQLKFLDGEPFEAVHNRIKQSEMSCIVTETFANKNGVKKGDIIEIPSTKGMLKVAVQNIYYDYASDLGYVVLSRQLQQKYFPASGYSSCAIYCKPGFDANVVRSNLLATMEPNARVNVLTNKELRQEVLRVFDDTFAITHALHAISVLVAILGVANSLYAMTMEMRQELAILRFVGASMNQLRQIILYQAAFLGGLGALSGTVVGAVLSLLLINVINKQSFGWTINLSVPWIAITESFLLVVFFSVISGLLPALSIKNLVTPDAVRNQ